MKTQPRRLFLRLLLISPLVLGAISSAPVGRVAGAAAAPVGKPVHLAAALQNGGDPDADLEHIKNLIEIANAIRENLGPEGENKLSSGGLQFVTLGDRADSLTKAMGGMLGSNPLEAEDFISRQAGNTQSETSVANFVPGAGLEPTRPLRDPGF